MKGFSKFAIFLLSFVTLAAIASAQKPRDQFQTTPASKKTEKVKTADDKKRAIKPQLFEGKWYRIVKGGLGPIRQSFRIDRDANGKWRLSGMMALEVYDVRLEGAEFKFKDHNPDFATNEYAGSLSPDGSRLRFTARAMPPTTSKQKERQMNFGPPNDRFGHEEWLRE
jgi:hypothetical protein